MKSHVLGFLLLLPSFMVNNVASTTFHHHEGIYFAAIGASLRCGGEQHDDVVDLLKTNKSGGAGSSPSAVVVSKKMYNKQASNWVRTEPRCLSDFTGRPVVFDMISSELKITKEFKGDSNSNSNNKTVLDIGCGEGYCARKVVEMGAWKVIGNDISEAMIQSAIAQTAEDDSRFKYYSAPCNDLLKGMDENSQFLGIKKAESSIDVAMAIFLFNYLTTVEMENVVLQIYKALKADGIFVFSVPHPSMLFCHGNKDSTFHLNSEGMGYYSSRNEKILGQISTIDGTTLNIMSIHKTMNDYMQAIQKAGFQIIDIKEVGVTEEHMKLNPEFFNSVKDRPLHLIFKLRKPS